MIKDILKHDFSKKVISLFSGSIISNIISLGAFFVIAKLYNIDILGQYYMYMSIILIFGELSSLGYLSSIQVLNDEELKKMYNSIFLLAICILVLIFPFLYYYSQFALYIIITVILTLYYMLAEKIFIRNMETKKLNTIRIGRVTINAIFIIVSFFIFGGDDINYIIIMNILSIIFIDLYIFLFYFKKDNLIDINLNYLRILVEQKEFPKYVGPGLICHTIAYQIPILVAGTFFSPTIAAQYNMAYKLVYTPGILISSSISNVFQGRLSKLFRANKDIFQGFNKFVYILFIVAIVFIFSIIFILPYFVEYFFDIKWSGSIDISMALLPLIFSLMAISPLLGVLKFTNNLKYGFRLQFASLLIAIISFSISVMLNDFLLGVIIFASLMLIAHIKMGFKLFEIKRKANAK